MKLGKNLVTVGIDETNSEWFFLDEDGIGYSAYDITAITSTLNHPRGPLGQMLQLLKLSK
jgi:hypothetical protein